MKQTIIILVFLFMISGAMSALATADGPDCWAVKGVAKGDVLNIRTAANASAKIIGKIPHNAQNVGNSTDFECPDVPNAKMPKECGSGWCKVTYNSVTGWVNCKFLQESSDCNR